MEEQTDSNKFKQKWTIYDSNLDNNTFILELA